MEPKIVLPKTELSADEFIQQLKQLLSENKEESDAAVDSLVKSKKEIESNRDQLLGKNRHQ